MVEARGLEPQLVTLQNVPRHGRPLCPRHGSALTARPVRRGGFCAARGRDSLKAAEHGVEGRSTLLTKPPEIEGDACGEIVHAGNPSPHGPVGDAKVARQVSLPASPVKSLARVAE